MKENANYTLDPEVKKAVKSQADKESRYESPMANILLKEALVARGVKLG